MDFTEAGIAFTEVTEGTTMQQGHQAVPCCMVVSPITNNGKSPTCTGRPD